jgi:hypothetical protein
MPIAPAGAALRAGAPHSAHASRTSFAEMLRARAASPPAAAERSGAAAARAALQAVERARERLDGALSAARRGQTFTAQELLALQADAYRYTQTLEIASKAVEHAAQGVKQAVNTQV